MNDNDLLREVLAPAVLRKHARDPYGDCTRCVVHWGMEEAERWPCDAAKLALALMPHRNGGGG